MKSGVGPASEAERRPSFDFAQGEGLNRDVDCIQNLIEIHWLWRFSRVSPGSGIYRDDTCSGQ